MLRAGGNPRRLSGARHTTRTVHPGTEQAARGPKIRDTLPTAHRNLRALTLPWSSFLRHRSRQLRGQGETTSVLNQNHQVGFFMILEVNPSR